MQLCADTNVCTCVRVGEFTCKHVWVSAFVYKTETNDQRREGATMKSDWLATNVNLRERFAVYVAEAPAAAGLNPRT